MTRYSLLFVATLLYLINVSAQSGTGTNSFKNFDQDAVGRNDLNAYLLSQLSFMVYADQLAGYVGTSATTLNTDPVRFKAEFEKKIRPWFHTGSVFIEKTPVTSTSRITSSTPLTTIETGAPVFDFVTSSDNSGIDPEVMLISTPKTVFVVVRGTDRVGGSDGAFNYEWGEWIQTNGIGFPVPPCEGCDSKGKVHRGFKDALHYGNESTYISKLTEKIKTLAGSTKKIWITGHSLGGAMAQMIGFYLHQYKGIKAHGITVFASPHPGNATFATTLNNLYPNGRIQRYEFIEDPVTKLPGRYMDYGRAGQRNWMLKATGPSNILFNVGEREGNDFGAIALLASSALTGYGGACFHHPEWYVNACYSILSSTQKSLVPLPPALPDINSECCKQADINLGTTASYLNAGSATMEAGTYTIKNARTGKYLIATKSNCPLNINNCCPVVQNASSISQDDNKWILQKVDGALVTCYTLKNKKHGTVLDADAFCANSNNCKVQNCNRLPLGDRRMQEWAFVRLSNGNYSLRCVAGEKYLRVNPDCIENNNCGVLLYKYLYQSDQEFVLSKVN